MARKVDAVFRLVNQFSPEMLRVVASMEEGGTAAKNLAREYKKIGRELSGAGDTLTKGLTVPIIGAGTAIVAAADVVDQGEDAITRATGATGQALQDMFTIQKNVASGVQASYEEIGSALGEINTRFGYTDEALEKSTTMFMRFAESTGMDATEAVRLASRAMGDAGIEADEYSRVLDMVAKASQVSGIAQNTLFENMTKYGAPMRALGFEMEESMALFSAWEKAGVNTEIAFSGMKKAISNWGAAGKDPREEFKKTLSAIQSAPDIASATSMAIEAFGAKAGPDLADAIKNGRFEYEDFLAVIENSEGTVDATWGAMQDGVSKFEMAKNTLMGASTGFRDSIMGTLAPMVTAFAGKVKVVSEWFNNLSDDQKEFVVKAAMVVAAIGPVLSVLGRLSIGIGKNINTFIKIVKLVKIVGSAMKLFFCNPVGLVIMAVVALAIAAYKIYQNWDKIVPFFKNLWGKVTSFFSEGLAWINNNFPLLGIIIQNQIDTISTIFGGLKTVFGGVIDFIKGVFTGDWELAWTGVKKIFSGIFQMLAGIAKAPINAVISIINGAIKRINKIGFTVPDWVPGIGGKDFHVNIPEIPKLYKGTGYWPGGVAMIHDRGGEIIDLPRGSRVYPHDTSVAMARREGADGGGVSVTIAKLADQIVVRDNSDIEKITVEVAQRIVKEVKKSQINKGDLGVAI